MSGGYLAVWAPIRAIEDPPEPAQVRDSVIMSCSALPEGQIPGSRTGDESLAGEGGRPAAASKAGSRWGATDTGGVGSRPTGTIPP